MAGLAMPDDVSNVGTSTPIARRLRLRRVFLRSLVISLTTCALVAVVVLLLGEFNETTARILGTLAALAVHSGIAMFCADTLERQRWPWLSRVGLTAFGVNFCVLITCLWWPGGPDIEALRAITMTGALAAAYLLAIPCADLCERGLWPRMSLAGLVACAVALLMTCVCIWAEETEAIWFAKATGIVSIVAFSLAHSCLLVRVPGGLTLARLFRATVACMWALAGLASVMIVWEIEDELAFRVLGALGVLAACGSLSLLILAKLRQVGKIEKLQTAAARIELRCPRCMTAQTVDAGAARCSTCGLRLKIEIEEPRCPKCDYLLWQLPERRCPECGTPF